MKTNGLIRHIMAVVALVCIASSIALADSVRFIAGTWTVPTGVSGATTKARDLTDALLSNLITGVTTPNPYSMAPTTNAAENYVDRSVGENKSAIPDGIVGSKNGISGTPDPVAGEYMIAVAGNAGDRGYAHIFSSTTVTGSAYYTNTVPAAMATSPAWNMDSGTVCSNVNPAYVIPGFGVVWPTNGQMIEAAQVFMLGEVGTSAAGGNNQLADSMVNVAWENLTLGSNGMAGVTLGTWQATVPLAYGAQPVTNTLRARALGFSPRAGLPVSVPITVQVVVVPEPVTMLAMLPLLAAVRRRASQLRSFLHH